MPRQVLHGKEAREAISRGVDKLADAVVCTLGPKGRCAILEGHHPLWPPRVTKDGVTVAKEVRDLEDPFENIGANLIREAANRTSGQAGDGTTTATLLAREIYKLGAAALEDGANPQGLKRGIDAAVAVIVEHIAKTAQKVEDSETIARVGTISSNGDRKVGEMIASAMDKVGRDGVITVTESNDTDMHLKIVEGMQIDRGFVAFPFVANMERMETILLNARVLITERKLWTMPNELSDVLAEIGKNGNPVLIVAGDYDQPFVVMLIHNNQVGTLKSVPVKAPAFGDLRRAMLEDLAIVTGAYAFTEDCGRPITSVTIEDFGFAERIEIRGQDAAGTTTFAGGGGDPDKRERRMQLLRTLIETSDNDHERENLKLRLGKIAAGVAVLKVGAPTKAEMEEKRDRVEDAVCATKAAVKEGIVPGGGIAYLQASEYPDRPDWLREKDELLGYLIVRQALAAPFKKIIENAGGNPLDMLIECSNRMATGERHLGYNAAAERWEDLVAAGIIDPAMVVRCALQNAASVASTLLLTECSVCSIPERK